MPFYIEIDSYKKTYKLNNKDLGEIIGMSADGFRMAVNRKSLSSLEVKALEGYFKELDEKRIPNKSEQSNPAIDSMAKELLKNSVFREGIKQIQKEISTDELRAEIERMIEKAKMSKTIQK